MTLRQLARAQTYGGGCVVSLSCLGHLVAAGDFLGSVTLLQLLANRRGVALLATSLDRHPIFAQVCVWGGGGFEEDPWMRQQSF